MRPMGLFCMEASPVSSLAKVWPARMPEISRAVVPLLPQSRMPEGFCKAVEPFSVNQDPPWILINSDSHAAEAADGGETVRSLQKMGDFRGSLSQGAQHDSPV